MLRPPASTLTLPPLKAESRPWSARLAPVAPPLAGLSYLGLCLAPLILVWNGWQAVPRRPFLIELSVSFGYLGLGLLVLQFLLTSKAGWLQRPFKLGTRHRFHRQMAVVALAFLGAHVALLLIANPARYLPLFDLFAAPWRARWGVLSMILLLTLTLLVVWKKRLRLSPVWWRQLHGLGASAAVGFALAHLLGVDHFSSSWGGTLLILTSGLIVLLLSAEARGLLTLPQRKPRKAGWWRKTLRTWSPPLALSLGLLGFSLLFAASHM